MFDLADLRLIQAISTAPSLAAAARALDVTPPAVSQRLVLLEERLRVKLVERRGSGPLRLTLEGELMASRAAAILKDLSALSDALSERRGAIAGPLRIVAPLGYGRLRITPLLASFVRLHPEVNPTLLLADDPWGMTRAGSWDLMISVGRLPDLGVIQKKIASNRRFLCASPHYLAEHGTPTSPLELRQHRCGVIRENQADVSLWSLAGPQEQRASIRITPSFTSNDGEVIRAWALAGMGIVERSEWSIVEDLRSGQLVRVLPKWSLPDADVVVLINPHGVRTQRVDAFIRHLASNV